MNEQQRTAVANVKISWDARLPWDIESVRHRIELGLSIPGRCSVVVTGITETTKVSEASNQKV